MQSKAYYTMLELTPYTSMHENCTCAQVRTGAKGSCKKWRCLARVCDYRFAFVNKVFEYESSLRLLVSTSAFSMLPAVQNSRYN